MTRMRSTLPRAAFLTCGLSLVLLGGCPQPSGGNGNDNQGSRTGGNGNENRNGGGGGALDRSKLVRPASPTLFVADPTIGIVSFRQANTADGNVAPNTFIDFLERVRRSNDPFPMTAKAVGVDRIGALVLYDATPAVRFFNNAATITGIPAPNRAILEGSVSRLEDEPDGAMAFDRENDRLFVAVSDRVLVFEGAKLSGNGEVAPTRFFSNSDLGLGESIALGPNGDLYVSDGSQSVLVFANAGGRSGAIAPDRVITLSFFNTQRIFVDADDRLYVADDADIAVFDNAATLDGSFDDFRTMRLTPVGSTPPVIRALSVDSRGIGYAGDVDGKAIHIIDDIGTRTGDIAADRLLSGSAVVFERPFAIFLWE
ncbi:MAG: hypothetical protein AB7N71_06455 [Phycisphaerae bacterium]